MVDVTWSGDILCSDDREQEVVLPHLVYLPIHVDKYHLVGAIHDPVEEESAVGGRKAEAICVDMSELVVLLLSEDLLDAEVGGAVGVLGAVADHVMGPPDDVAHGPMVAGISVGQHLHGAVSH